jgi:hypothetical protein
VKRLLLPLWATACVLGLSAAASAKEELFGLRICGASECRDVGPWAGSLYGATTGPARPAPYYAITYLDRDGRPVSLGWPALYYVPSAGVVRRDSGLATWSWASGTSLRDAVRGLRPFPRPRLARVTVAGRRARDPDSYLRLYELPPSRRSPADPAGRPGGANDLWRYYERVRRHWIAVNLWSSRPTPWGDGANFVWVSRRGAVLKRDDELLRISPALARRVRRGVSLRGA